MIIDVKHAFFSNITEKKLFLQEAEIINNIINVQNAGHLLIKCHITVTKPI